MSASRRRLWVLGAFLILLNLALMAVDSLVLPAQGLTEMAPLNPPPKAQTRIPRRPTQLDLLMGRLGVRNVDLTSQPVIRPPLTEPRPRTPARNEPVPALRPFSLHQPGWGGLALHLVGLLALASTSLVLTFFLPDRFRVMRDTLGGAWAHKFRTLGIGILGYLAALLLTFLLAVVVSGLPYALLVLGVLAVVTAVGVTAVFLKLGRWLSSLVGAEAQPLAQLLLGILVAFPSTIIPYAGWAAAALLASFGMGAILLTRMGSGRPWSLDALRD